VALSLNYSKTLSKMVGKTLNIAHLWVFKRAVRKKVRAKEKKRKHKKRLQKERQ
jgi:hypothetical protein